MQSLRTALINRDYARLWYGQAVSTVGDYVFDTTLVLWVATVLAKGQSWGPVAVSGILLSVGAAVLVIGPLAGVFVDRWNRKATMLRTEVVRAVLAAMLTVLSFLPARSLPTWAWLALIYVVVFVMNAAGQFFSPARFATVGDVVHGEVDRTRAAGLGQATTAAAGIIGPPIAAPLLFTIGLQWALAINAASYVFSYIAIRGIRAPGASARRADPVASGWAGIRAEFVAGLQFFARSRFLVVLLSIAAICQFGTGALNTLDVFFVTQNLHANSQLYGFMSTAFGVGAILGALWAGRVVRLLGARAATWAGLLVTGSMVFIYARQSHFVAGLLLLALVSIPVSMLNSAMTPLLLGVTPPEYLGRMAAVFNPVSQLASILSVVLAGWLASSVLHNFHTTVAGLRFGPIDTIFAASGALILLAGLYASVMLPHDPEPASAEADLAVDADAVAE